MSHPCPCKDKISPGPLPGAGIPYFEKKAAVPWRLVPLTLGYFWSCFVDYFRRLLCLRRPY